MDTDQQAFTFHWNYWSAGPLFLAYFWSAVLFIFSKNGLHILKVWFYEELMQKVNRESTVVVDNLKVGCWQEFCKRHWTSPGVGLKETPVVDPLILDCIWLYEALPWAGQTSAPSILDIGIEMTEWGATPALELGQSLISLWQLSNKRGGSGNWLVKYIFNATPF